MGFANVPDTDCEFTSADIDALQTLRRLVGDGVLREPQTIELTRTLGRTTNRLANSVAEAMGEWLDAARDHRD